MSKREKILEFLCVKYPEFLKKHALGVLLVYSIFMLFAMFVVSGDFYKFIHSETFYKIMQYFSEHFKFFITAI